MAWNKRKGCMDCRTTRSSALIIAAIFLVSGGMAGFAAISLAMGWWGIHAESLMWLTKIGIPLPPLLKNWVGAIDI
jgi:hypothetical protein